MTAYLDGNPPRAFAHRGWHIDELAALENSMPAFRRAYDEGFRFLETDVHATADGQLVAFHDLSLTRVTDRGGQIAALPWAQVRQARIAGTEPIPLLADLLEEFPDARFNIDAKADSAVGPLADLIRRTGTGGRVCLGSFSDRRVASLRALLGPDVATSMGPREVFRLLRVSRLRRPFTTPAVAAQVPVSFSRVKIVTPAFLATAHGAGVEVHVWTIDDPAEMRRLLDLGVDGLMTDRPDLLRRALADRGGLVIRDGLVRFFYGPMDCGKSTLALQIHQNQVRQGRRGLLLTRLDRSGPARISSRIGISSPAREVTDDLDLARLARDAGPVDYLVVDEAQFLTAAQVDQLGLVADELAVEVYAFGIATDFRSMLFPGSARFFEIADQVAPVQVEVLCWCGRQARFNGRVVDGRLARQGPTVLVADTEPDREAGPITTPESTRDRVRYQVLCRRHYRSGELAPNPTRSADV